MMLAWMLSLPGRCLARMGLRFPPALESAFAAHCREVNVSVARYALLSAVLLNASYGYLDILLATEHRSFLLTIRYFWITPLLLAAYLLSHSHHFPRCMTPTLSVAAIVTTLGIGVSMAVAFEEVGHAYFFGVVIVNLYVQAFSRMPFVTSSVVAILNTVIINVACLAVVQPVTYEYLFMVDYFLLTTLVLGAAIAFSIERAQRQAFLQARSLSATNRELERNSRTDPLTGLPNRRSLAEEMARLAEQLRPHRGSYSAMLIDIDHFKRINDRYGHDCGDKILQRFALTLRRMLRSDDIVGRWGGEEFLVILPNTRGPGARLAGLKLNRAIRETGFVHDGKRLDVTATLGVAEGGPGMDVDDVIRRADAALYEGKRSGRDTVVLQVDMHERACTIAADQA